MNNLVIHACNNIKPRWLKIFRLTAEVWGVAYTKRWSRYGPLCVHKLKENERLNIESKVQNKNTTAASKRKQH